VPRSARRNKTKARGPSVFDRLTNPKLFPSSHRRRMADADARKEAAEYAVVKGCGGLVLTPVAGPLAPIFSTISTWLQHVVFRRLCPQNPNGDGRADGAR